MTCFVERIQFGSETVYESDVASCRVGKKKVVSVPPRRMLPGTTIAHTGDRGRLVLSREVALNLSLV